MSNIKLIIFDLDGTLIDAYEAIINSFNFTMRKTGYPEEKSSVVKRAVGWGDEKLLEPFVEKRDRKTALAVYRKHHAEALKQQVIMTSQTRATLESLKAKGIKLAIATNRPSRFSRIIINTLGVGSLFDSLLCADMIEEGKPNPGILNKTLERFGYDKDQALYVGDMTIDAITGRRAGIKTLIVVGGSSSVEEIKKEKPDRILKGISEIKEVLINL